MIIIPCCLLLSDRVGGISVQQRRGTTSTSLDVCKTHQTPNAAACHTTCGYIADRRQTPIYRSTVYRRSPQVDKEWKKYEPLREPAKKSSNAGCCCHVKNAKNVNWGPHLSPLPSCLVHFLPFSSLFLHLFFPPFLSCVLFPLRSNTPKLQALGSVVSSTSAAPATIEFGTFCR